MIQKIGKKRCNRLWLLFIACVVVSGEVMAGIRLPALVGDNMVLQRNVKLPLWGWADPGETIAVTFMNKTSSTTADKNGKWSLKLNACSAGGPYEMIIKGRTEEIKLKNILIGEVWVCSGQSNMVFDFVSLKTRYANEIASSENDQIRQVLINRTWSASPAENVKTSGWKSANPQNIISFSAAGYFFAKELFDKYQIPIGLINTSWGGTRAQAWTDEETLRAFPQFGNEIALLKDSVQISRKKEEYAKRIADWKAKITTDDKGYANGKPAWNASDLDDSPWKTAVLPATWDRIGLGSNPGSVWFRKVIEIPDALAGKDAVLKAGVIDDEDETFINGEKVGGVNNSSLRREYRISGNLLKPGRNIITIRMVNYSGAAGITSTTPMELKIGDNSISLNGEWKCQAGMVATGMPGNYNVQDLSASIYNGMIAPLIPYAIRGVIWYQGESNSDRAFEYRTLFPAMIGCWRKNWGQGDFPFIYQQLVNFMAPGAAPADSKWAELREAQLMSLSVANTGMAVGIDAGEANDIHPKDKKTIGQRLALIARKIVYGEKKLVASAPVYESMKVKDNKIILSFRNNESALVAKNGELKHFAIAGADKKFVWATAVIKGNTIEVWNDAIAHPVAVRYAWANNPEGCNLYNTDGLPVSPFRTDDWPGLTAPK